MKILVVFTGGTIGSTVNDGYISPDDSTTYQLIEQYKALKKRDVEFTFVEPYTSLSENVTGEHLKCLGNCLLEQIGQDYDGIIVTHGTDTLQYSAACMSYLLPNLQIPVIFVSSNYVLDDPRANGLVNFAYAVEFIATRQGTGIFVIYRNNDRVIYVHRGTRLLPHLPYSDDLFSVGGQYYGIYKNDQFVANANYQATAVETSYSLSLPDVWNSDILRIFPYPGMEYPKLPTHTRAILLDTYHSGTLCSITPNMEAFFAAADEKNIPIFLTGADSGMDYDSVKAWKKLQICTLPKASPIAMYVKLWMALHSEKLLDRVTLNNIMLTPIDEDIV